MKIVDLQTKFESYLLTQKRVSQNTFAAYKRDLQQFVQYITKKKVTLKELHKKHIKAFLKALHTQQLSASSMARKISTLKSFFNFANERFELHNFGKELVIPKIEKKLPEYLTEKQIKQLFDTVAKDETIQGQRNKVMLYLLYVSGMRVSELTNAKTSAIQFDTGVMHIEGKGGKQRLIPLPHSVLQMIRIYLNAVHAQLTYKKGYDNKTDYLFPVRYAGKIKPISRQAFWGSLKDLCAKSGIGKNISPHKVRHSLATHMLKKGADLRSLQLLLGHENLATVQIYTHIETSHLRKIYDKKHPRS